MHLILFAHIKTDSPKINIKRFHNFNIWYIKVSVTSTQIHFSLQNYSQD